jgi:hypothetical protein
MRLGSVASPNAEWVHGCERTRATHEPVALGESLRDSIE